MALGDNRSRRATQVEIDLAVAHVGEHLCRPHKLVRVLGHQLRHHVEPLVIGRIDLLKRLAAKAVSHPRRRQKRRVIAIERTEALRMHATEHMPGNPLHGGQRKDHLLFSHINTTKGPSLCHMHYALRFRRFTRKR